MMSIRRTFRNLISIVANPPMAVAYTNWIAGRINGEVLARLPYGAEIGGFENFSNYWGTLNKIPGKPQIDGIAKYLQGDGAVCFDVGANIGSFSLILGKRLPDCVIHAFEPAPNTFGILTKNIGRNNLPNVSPHQLAVAEANGSVRFTNEPSISQRNHIVTAEERELATCEVPSTSLDAFCELHDIPRIGFIKVDCEGVEPLVLCGSRRLLGEKKIGAMLVEVCPRNLSVFGFTIRDLLDAVAEVPYSFHRFGDDGVVGEKLSEEQMCAVASEDFLLLPN